jgi:hypothetical protein
VTRKLAGKAEGMLFHKASSAISMTTPEVKSQNKIEVNSPEHNLIPLPRSLLMVISAVERRKSGTSLEQRARFLHNLHKNDEDSDQIALVRSCHHTGHA